VSLPLDFFFDQTDFGAFDGYSLTTSEEGQDSFVVQTYILLTAKRQQFKSSHVQKLSKLHYGL